MSFLTILTIACTAHGYDITFARIPLLLAVLMGHPSCDVTMTIATPNGMVVRRFPGEMIEQACADAINDLIKDGLIDQSEVGVVTNAMICLN